MPEARRKQVLFYTRYRLFLIFILNELIRKNKFARRANEAFLLKIINPL